jgi:ATP-dependent Clp protease ATP-binding subunit ClpC
MFERFTDRARRVMALANMEARRLEHEYIGTEHILLGMVREGSGVAANVLKNLNVDLARLQAEVEKFIRSGPDNVVLGKLPQTPRAKKVIEYAIEEARAQSVKYVGTEHLLVGLLREKDGVAAMVLTDLGLHLDNVLQEVLKCQGLESPEAPATPHPSMLHLRMILALLNDPSDPLVKILSQMCVDLDDFRRRAQRVLDDNQRPH